LPTGALIVIVQVRPEPEDGVQFGEPAARFTTVAVPPFTEIDADWVFGEMYCGCRRNAEPVVDDPGILIETATLWGVVPEPVGAAVLAARGSDEPPPPLHAVTSTPRKAQGNSRLIIVLILSFTIRPRLGT
jgi:hypothetical protein